VRRDVPSGLHRAVPAVAQTVERRLEQRGGDTLPAVRRGRFAAVGSVRNSPLAPMGKSSKSLAMAALPSNHSGAGGIAQRASSRCKLVSRLASDRSQASMNWRSADCSTSVTGRVDAQFSRPLGNRARIVDLAR
jgi:hypothetical protein